MFAYIYICIYVKTYICIYIYILLTQVINVVPGSPNVIFDIGEEQHCVGARLTTKIRLDDDLHLSFLLMQAFLSLRRCTHAPSTPTLHTTTTPIT